MKKMQKFYIIFLSFGMLMVLFLTIDSKVFERVAMFIPIVAVATFWFWVRLGEKKRDRNLD